MQDNIPLSELRMIRGYKDIKKYLYRMREEAKTAEERAFYSSLIYELYEADYSLCSWIED